MRKLIYKKKIQVDFPKEVSSEYYQLQIIHKYWNISMYKLKAIDGNRKIICTIRIEYEKEKYFMTIDIRFRYSNQGNLFDLLFPAIGNIFEFSTLEEFLNYLDDHTDFDNYKDIFQI